MGDSDTRSPPNPQPTSANSTWRPATARLPSSLPSPAEAAAGEAEAEEVPEEEAEAAEEGVVKRRASKCDAQSCCGGQSG